MKKILLLICLLYTGVAVGQEAIPPKKVSVKDMLGDDSFEANLSVFDMKFLHDREIMTQIVQGLYAADTTPQKRQNENLGITEVVFNQKDSRAFDGLADAEGINYGLTDQDLTLLLSETYERPFSTFKNVIMNSKLPIIPRSEISKINQVDKQAVSNFVQTLSEAGPDIGAAPVSVDYNNEI